MLKVIQKRTYFFLFETVTFPLVDVFDSKNNEEPEVKHKSTPIKPIPLRSILEAIHDYAFVASEYDFVNRKSFFI